MRVASATSETVQVWTAPEVGFVSTVPEYRITAGLPKLSDQVERRLVIMDPVGLVAVSEASPTMVAAESSTRSDAL